MCVGRAHVRSRSRTTISRRNVVITGTTTVRARETRSMRKRSVAQFVSAICSRKTARATCSSCDRPADASSVTLSLTRQPRASLTVPDECEAPFAICRMGALLPIFRSRDEETMSRVTDAFFLPATVITRDCALFFVNLTRDYIVVSPCEFLSRDRYCF